MTERIYTDEERRMARELFDFLSKGCIADRLTDLIRPGGVRRQIVESAKIIEAEAANSEEYNSICECGHLKETHDLNGCEAFQLGCKCSKIFNALRTPVRFIEVSNQMERQHD